MKILSRYVVKEHIGPLTFALAALTSLLLLNYIARRFGDLVGKGLPWQAIAEFFLLSVPFTVAMTLPMAVLVATLYAFSRLASENEITAFKASGVSMPSLLRPVLAGAACLAAFMIFFNDQVLPAANHRLSQLQQDIGRTKPTFALREQVINEVTDEFLLRAGHIESATNMMREVTIYDLANPQGRRTIYADSGAIALAENRQDLQLTLYDGVIQETAIGKPEQIQRIRFTTDLVRVRGVANSFVRDSAEGFKSDREMTICELQQALDRARYDYNAARIELDVQLADSVGKERGAPPRATRSRGVGYVYCSAMNAIRVKTARAAEPPRALAQDTTPRGARPAAVPQDTAPRRVDSARTDTAAAAPATPAPTTPAPTTAAQRDSLRAQARSLLRGARRDSAGTPQASSPAASQPASQPVPQPGLPSAARPASPPVPPSPAATPPTPGAVVGGALGGPPAAAVPTVPAVPAGASAAARAAASGVPHPPPAVDADSAKIVHSGESVGASRFVALAIARERLRESRNSMNGYDVEIQKKFAISIACIVFVLLGAPIALRFPRGGVGLVIGVSLFVFALYYCGLIAGEELANRGYLPAPLAMWAANILLTIVGLGLAARMGRESGSNRSGGLGEMWEALRARFARRGAGGEGLGAGARVAR